MSITPNERNLSLPEVICFGEALVDRLGPLGGDPSFGIDCEDCLGGAPANVACALAKLGIPTAFCGRLGKDFIGERFSQLMDSRGVDLTGLQIDEKWPSRIVLVSRDKKGDRQFQGFEGASNKGAFADQEIELNTLRKAWPDLSRNARWLVIGTIPLASNASAESLLWVIEEALSSDLPIALDVNWRPTFWDMNLPPASGPDSRALEAISPILQSASLIKLAKEEAIWFFENDSPLVIANSLPRKPSVVVTDGANPVRWCISGSTGEMATISPYSVVDTTGAGDSFTAGLIYQFLKSDASTMNKGKVPGMIRFAAACGALVCSGAGAIDPQPTYEEVAAFLLNNLGGGGGIS